ncbi:hypothetical protein ACHAWF_011940 [Thalassiosira exigua]
MNARRSTSAAAALAFPVLAVASCAHAFITPLQQLQPQLQRRVSPVSLNALPEFNPLLLADGLSAATYMGGGGSDDLSSLSGTLSTLRTFFIVLTGTIFGITAIAYLTAAFLVPRAAEQLERDTKRLRPGLWEEYESKLEEGESMVTRPDLLQELGNIMQPIIVEDYEREAEMKFGGDVVTKGNDGAGTDVKTPAADKTDAIDVTIVQREE